MKTIFAVLVIAVLAGCGREGVPAPKSADHVIYDCGPGVQCPIYIIDGKPYYKDPAGNFQPLG